jgi:hypothetical protein
MALQGVTATRNPSLLYEVNSGGNRLHTTNVVSGNGLQGIDFNHDKTLQGKLFSVNGSVELAADGQSIFSFYSPKPLQIQARVIGTKEAKFEFYQVSSVDASSVGLGVTVVNQSAANSAASVVTSFNSAVSLANTGGIVHNQWGAGNVDLGFSKRFETDSGINYAFGLLSVVASNVIMYDFLWSE